MSTEKVESAEQFEPTTPEVCEICGKPTPRIELWNISFLADESSGRKIKEEDDWFEYFDVCPSCYQKVRSIAESEPEHVNPSFQYCYFCNRPTPDGYGWNICQFSSELVSLRALKKLLNPHDTTGQVPDSSRFQAAILCLNWF